jgi:site-specific DNA-cytosine methylase
LREVVINELPNSKAVDNLLPTPSASQEPGWTVQPVDKHGNSTTNPNERWYHPETGRLMQKGVIQALNFGLQEELLRTPSVVDSTGGAISETQARQRGRMVKVADQVAELAFDNNLKVSPSIADSLLPTPTVGHVRNHDEPVEDYLQRRQDYVDGKTKGMPGASLGVSVRMEMLPTPQALEGHHGNNLSVSYRENQGRQVMLSNHAVDISNNNEITLLPTEQVDDAKNTGHNQSRRTTLASEVWQTKKTTNWGKFEPAIKRWEALTRPAPAPTKPDGRDGAHRLSAEFTEWMMGLPEGWVTAEDIGLKRNDQLKACGNGVVPQQAEMALRILLQDINI